MKLISNLLLWGGILLLPLTSYAQFTKGLSYRAETGVSFSGGEHTPFWLTANKQGLSSIEKNNGYLRVGVFRELEFFTDVVCFKRLDNSSLLRTLFRRSFADVRRIWLEGLPGWSGNNAS